MKKTSKKFLLLLMIAIIGTVILMTLQATAVSSDKLDIIEYSSEDISAEKLEQIVKSMCGISDEKSIEKGNVLCIFGHSKATGVIKTTEHNYYSTAPRCKETISNVEYCTRSGCDYFVTTGQTTFRVGCH